MFRESGQSGQGAPIGRPGKRRTGQPSARRWLSPGEVELLEKAAGQVGRHGHRDRAIITVMFTHGLRVGELVGLRRSQVDLDGGQLHVTNRLKNGRHSIHPLRGKEIRALRKIFRDKESPFVFTSERGAPLTVSAVQKMVQRAGERAGFSFRIHPHMLRHACGFKLANDGIDTRAIQQYLGHQRIENTVHYTEMAAGRFEGFWRD